MMRHSRRAQPALLLLSEIDPAIAALSLWCSYRDSEGPTMTQGDTIHVGPDFAALPISEQTGLIAHHILHVALRHSVRRAAAKERYGLNFQAQLYDLACDALVNEALLQAGHALARPAVRAAEIAMRLTPADRPENVLSDWDSDRLYTIMIRSASSGADQGAIESYALAQGFSPDLGDSDPNSSAPEVWSARLDQALREGQRAGSGIGALASNLGDLPQAVIPWEVKLRRMLNKALAQPPRQSHRRPSRSWLARDSLARETATAAPAFEPGRLRIDRKPRLVIGIDTSSSIPEDMLSLFAAEALSSARRTGAQAHLLGFDTDVHTRTKLENVASVTSLKMRTGGGTDYDEVLSEAQTMDPSYIIMLTDLDASMTVMQSHPLLWTVPAKPRIMPPFGSVLVMDDMP